MTYIVVCNGFHMLWVQYAYAVKSYSYMETMPAKEHFLRALWNAQNDITKRCQTWALISKPVTIHKIFFQIISRKNNHVLAWYVSKNETLKIWANIAFTAHVSGRFLIRFLIDISQSKHWCGKLRQNEYWQVNHPLELHQTGDLT